MANPPNRAGLTPDAINRLLEISRQTQRNGANFVPPWEQQQPRLPSMPYQAPRPPTPKKDEKKKVARTKSGKNLPSAQIIPPTIPYNPTIQLKDALEMLTDDKLDIIFGLFDFDASSYAPQEKIPKFLENTLRPLFRSMPDIELPVSKIVQTLHNAIEPKQILPQLVLPYVFNAQTVKFSKQKILQLYVNGIDIEGPQDDTYILLTISYPMSSINRPRAPIIVNNKEVLPGSFGTATNFFYYINPGKKLATPYHVTFPPAVIESLAIFTVYYAHRKPYDQITREILNLPKNPVESSIPLTDIFYRSKNRKCMNCRSFRIIDLIESMMKTSFCRCPICGQEIQLTELVFDPVEDPTKVDIELKKAREQMCNSLNSLVKTNLVDDSRADALVNGEVPNSDQDPWDFATSKMEYTIDGYIDRFEKLMNVE